MRPQNASRQQAVTQFAEKEHGVLGCHELYGLGLTASSVRRWTADGRLHRVHRGVYAVGRPDLTIAGQWLAAVKACGLGALLSHECAAALWGLRQLSTRAIHVITPRRVRPVGIEVHRVPPVEPDDIAKVDRIPVTSVARTLADCAEVLPTREVVRLLEQAERLRLFDLRALKRRPSLSTALAQMEPEPPRVNSPWERDLLDLCADHGIPRPELNVMVEGFEVDALWSGPRVIAELDGYSFHRSRRAFVEDRRRDAKLQLAGYMVLRLTALEADTAQLLSAAVAAR
jgi:hypothetical protein